MGVGGGDWGVVSWRMVTGGGGIWVVTQSIDEILHHAT